MGFLYNTKKVRSYILIILILISFAIAVPLRNTVTSYMEKGVTMLTDMLYDKYGISFSYDSLSPSVLTAFSVKGINIYYTDGNNGKNTVLTIDNAKITYSIFKLLKQNFNEGIKNIIIDGINLDINDLLKIIPKEKKEKEDNKEKLTFSKILEMIPNNLKLKNLNFVYNHEKFNVKYSIKNVNLSSKSNNTALELNINSVLNVFISSLNKNVSCNLGIFGAVTDTFDNSQLNLSFTDILFDDIKINKLNFHANYINNIIDVHTIQMTEPVSIGVYYDLNTNNFSAHINTDNLRAGNIIDNYIKNPTVQQFKNVKLTTDTIVTTNFGDKKLKFMSDSKVYIPENIIPGDIGALDISFKINGNEKLLNIEKLKAEGEKLMAKASLSFQYKDMQLSGIIELPYFDLPNGKTVSTEIYFDSKDKGFIGFSPQLFIGSKSFTAISISVLPQKDSIDFSFEMSDYSHMEESNPGVIKIDGSYLTKSKYLQSSVSLNTLYLDSIAKLAEEVLDEKMSEKISGFEKTLSPFVFSGDLYFSTDFKSISYNVPYILLANVDDESQVIMVSLNGNELSVQLNQLNVIYGALGIQLTGYVDRNPDSSDLFFELDVSSSTIPYHMTGTYMPGFCNIVGDYGTNFAIVFDKDQINGLIEMSSLPILVMDKSIIISTSSEVKYNKIDGPEVNINRFEVELIDTATPINPRLSFSGNATKYGIQLSTFTYSDYYSSLQGQTDIMIDFNQGILASASINLNLENLLSKESVNINGNLSNPGLLHFSKENLMNDFYIDIQAQVNDFCLDRFVKVQNEKNLVTGSIYASGTVAHPYATLALDNFSMYLGSSLITVNGNALLEDRELSLIGMNISYGNMMFKDFEAQSSLEDFTLDASCNFMMSEASDALRTPIKITVNNSIIPYGKIFPDTFAAEVEATLIEGSIIKKSFPLAISMLYSPMGISFLSSENIGLSGFLSPDGILEVNIDNGSFFKAKADGFIAKDIANIQLYDLDMDLSSLYEYVDLDSIIVFEKGNLSGEAVVTGSFAEPDINGYLEINDAKYKLPFITPEKLYTNKAEINIINNVAYVNPMPIRTRKGRRIDSSFNIYLDKWALDYIEGNVKTVKDDLFPGHLLMNFAKIEGDVSLDVDLLFQDSVLEITGDLFGENIKVLSGLEKITSMLKSNSEKEKEEEENGEAKQGMILKMDVNVTLGTHASVAFAPILRCIFVPNTKLRILLDPTTDTIMLDGELKLRSGDIAYLNRSFYIKSGAIKFNPDDITNPIVTLKAEVRERDDNGVPIKIILDVDNQPLLEINPSFRSEPPRSETEIRRMLGQIALADSENATDFIFAAGDFALQSTVIRQFENKLRDFMNFDIFSIRTNVLQNTLNMGFSGNFSKEKFSIGNFLDNSTVYIGKYLGSSLYLDAMLHVSFENNNFIGMTGPGSIIFQPEFGLEMESPFANIRLNLAPDINALLKNNQFVPSPSITLSWDFTF